MLILLLPKILLTLLSYATIADFVKEGRRYSGRVKGGCGNEYASDDDGVSNRRDAEYID